MPPEVTALVAGPSAADLKVCRAILAEGSRSFSAAALLLPRRVRWAASGFYAFCRVADDLVDEASDPGGAVIELKRRLDRIYRHDPIDDPVDRVLCSVVHTHGIPRAPLDALIDGFVWDAQGRRYETLTDVLAYAARVASAVGVVMTFIMGRRDSETLARACDLGAAMQLTNICRDVGEDARRGRLYLPGTWLREEGIDPERLLGEPGFTPGLGRVVKRLLEEADRLYARGATGIPALPSDCRSAIRAAGWIYADIGRVIRQHGYDSVSSRARVGGLRKLLLVVRAWIGRDPVSTRDAAPPLDEVDFLLREAG